jgi:uncharacterized surface protein with fasciclin (FAS1) repeats
VRTRTKTLGVAAAFAAIAVSIPTAVQAYADPDTTPAPPTPSSSVPVPVAPIPDPQGPGCDAYKKQVPTGAGSFASMATQSGSEAIASNPDLSTFSAAISGKLNPAVNIVSVLDGGPYVVFAPTNDAFAKLDPAALGALKADPAQLTSVLFYHMVLGYLGPDDVHGKMPTQQGALINVTGKGGDIKINDTAKVVCGGITSRGAKIYMIDTVLSPADAPQPNGTSTTSSSSTATTTPTTTSSAPSAAEATPSTSAAPSTTKAPTG